MTRYLGLVLLLSPLPAFAAPADLCDAAAEQAAAESGVPLALMRAVTRVETGRNNAPWPWTLNVDGQGYWFDSAEDAVAAAEKAVAQGTEQVDVGCFQLNLRWHGARFADLSDMIDPMANARHAARFLTELHVETGDWRDAAAAYHSRTPELGEAYLTRLEAAHTADPLTLPDPPAAPRDNGYPLLLAGQAGAAGSIVPQGRAMTPLIGAP
ncbi:MAG: transglycosylase [Rhodobacteraceae bacterium PARR1]|nr:MAG: transglycosylase [Rhodobacteraceae bacterium PARR1]